MFIADLETEGTIARVNLKLTRLRPVYYGLFSHPDLLAGFLTTAILLAPGILFLGLVWLTMTLGLSPISSIFFSLVAVPLLVGLLTVSLLKLPLAFELSYLVEKLSPFTLDWFLITRGSTKYPFSLIPKLLESANPKSRLCRDLARGEIATLFLQCPNAELRRAYFVHVLGSDERSSGFEANHHA